METKVEILIDEETDTFRIVGEHSLTFYSIWNDMMLQAMAKERKAILELMEAVPQDDHAAYIHMSEFDSLINAVKSRGFCPNNEVVIGEEA